ncbi:hypothetical protein FHX82_004902 [Amycolatopsis bartoniae]|uniref:FAD-binding domain-containing protein n=1 Tax=Amycolatopsis bartoniae TaxID=941986 RepID=A0A8H9INZ4_9PSEU|nr:NAD(P)/FAD-dependent oxidoreductase [Amycolatopsis bartoniae]MBB2937826.1 hypothetical protein [Amycolatopsis bartoniae]GHF41000.1 hypothetical protein GCM10017566_13040 [Amycolatopsis bartoniae]
MDVLIAGAGPAGSTAARALAEAGLDVVVLERRDPLPEYHVALEPGPVPGGTAGVVLSFGDAPPRRFDDARVQVLPYRDAVLSVREAAVAAGARLVEAEPARVRRGDAEIEDVVRRFGEPVVLLDATGATGAGPGRGWATTGTWRGCALADEVLTHLTQPGANLSTVPLVVRAVPVPGGRATITVTTMSASPLPHQEVAAVVRGADPRLAGALPVGALVDHPVNAGFTPDGATPDGVLTLGEAAGLVNPFTGDGIANAVRSGELAAQAVLASPGDAERIAHAYRRGLRSAFVGYFQSARHAVRHYHLAWRILASSSTSEHPFHRQSHRAVLLGGAMAHDSLRQRRHPDEVTVYLAPFTLACNEVMVRRIGDEWPLLAMHTLGGREPVRHALRPSTLFAGALLSAGGHPDVRHAPVAAAIELALLGALAHSVPASEAEPLARGVDWRYASAVIAADYLLATATEVLTTTRPELAAAFSAWLASLVALRAEERVVPLWESFFEFPARTGAHLAGAGDADVAAVRRLGRTCGRLFLLAEDLALLHGRRSRLDTTLGGALAAGLSGLPDLAGTADEEEIRYRRPALSAVCEESLAAELSAADRAVAGLADARCRRVLNHFARSLAEPVAAYRPEEVAG